MRIDSPIGWTLVSGLLIESIQTSERERTMRDFKFLMLWSGDKLGMRKGLISPMRSKGIVGHWHGGNVYLPEPSEVKALLPKRYLKAWDRQSRHWQGLPQVWQDNRHNDSPLTIRLNYARGGKTMLTLYFQPIHGDEDQ